MLKRIMVIATALLLISCTTISTAFAAADIVDNMSYPAKQKLTLRFIYIDRLKSSLNISSDGTAYINSYIST